MHANPRGGPVGPESARELVGGFLSRVLGFSGPTIIRAIPGGRRQQRAVADVLLPASDGTPVMRWLVVGIVWPKYLLVCTANANPATPIFDDCERIFAAIHRMR